MISKEIELNLQDDHPLLSVEFAKLSEAANEEQTPLFYLFTDQKTKQTYFLTREDLNRVAAEEAEEYIIYPISATKYKELYKNKTLSLRSLDVFSSNFDIALCAIYADGFWQFGAGMFADYVSESTSWEVGTGFAFPVVLSLVSGVLRCMNALEAYKRRHGVEAPPEVRDEIIKDCAAYVVKCMVVMGCWELGEFGANLLLSLCGATPATFWAPLTIALCVGICQAVATVATQIADEKLRFGEVRSSNFELAKMFITNFISGAAWYAISLIPFGSTLSMVMLEPLAKVLGAVLAGITGVVASYLVNTFVPLATDKIAATSKSCSFFRPVAEKEQTDEDGLGFHPV